MTVVSYICAVCAFALLVLNFSAMFVTSAQVRPARAICRFHDAPRPSPGAALRGLESSEETLRASLNWLSRLRVLFCASVDTIDHPLSSGLIAEYPLFRALVTARLCQAIPAHNSVKADAPRSSCLLADSNALPARYLQTMWPRSATTRRW